MINQQNIGIVSLKLNTYKHNIRFFTKNVIQCTKRYLT